MKEKETGMGYYIVSVTLQDGKVFNKVIISDGKITQIFGEKEIPFQEKDIKEIRVTHDKWSFNP
jgi:bifunctional N-acetylglucosamine-1-phosphate-uridyltransferase/glucosamine-1-phosphate-acetyltransferase GlmU-like protein